MAVDPNSLRAMVAERLAAFSATRKDKISAPDPQQLLARKNPYLYRYLGFRTTEKMVEALLAAWLSSKA